MILVAGATGTTGGAVLRALRESGAAVCAMTRSDASAQALRDEGFDAAVGDLGDPASLEAALDGVRAAYVATPASPELPALETAFARACAQAGVEHLVMLSVIGAAPDAPLDFARMHHAAEEGVRGEGVPFTFLRPNGFMQNTLAWGAQIPSGTVAGPVMDARWSIIDVRDIAAVAVEAFKDAGTHAGETYTLTGAEASSPREQVAIVSEVTGTPLEVAEVTIAQAREQLLSFGLSEWTADRLAELFELYARGEAEAVSPDVERVTGHPARDYATFARDHAAAFAG